MIYAQTETEILNYSRLSYAGSARAAAMGGAFGALGGDISSWNLSPAAIGVFRKSSVTYTSVLNFSGNESGELTARKTSYLIGTVLGMQWTNDKLTYSLFRDCRRKCSFTSEFL